MAARRLLIVMLVLLGISSVIAIMVPEPNRDHSPQEESSVTGETGTTGTTGDTGSTDEAEGAVPEPSLTEETVDLDARRERRIKAAAGTRMILTVKSENGTEVELDGLGLSGFADPYAPAVFDLILPTEAGKFQVKAPGEKPGATIITE